jgi:hypothetical protein
MGRVSAEATGLVRSELQRLIDRPERTVVHRIQDVLEQRTGCLQAGRRLSEADVARVRREVFGQLPYTTELLGRNLYPQVRKVQLGEDGFQEPTLELRAILLEVHRRRVRYADYSLAVQFSFHSLARMVERMGLRTSIVHLAVETGSELSTNLLALRLGQGDLTFAVPFCQGLAFGEFVAIDGLLPAVDYVSDREGSGFVSTDASTLWRQQDRRTIGCRIRTFLSYDQLGTSQDELRDRWEVIREKHASLWPSLLEAAVTQNGGVLLPDHEGELVELGKDVAALVSTEVWSRTVHRLLSEG